MTFHFTVRDDKQIRVIIDTDAGFAVVHSVHRNDVDLVIIVIAASGAILGQVAYRANQFARTMTDA